MPRKDGMEWEWKGKDVMTCHGRAIWIVQYHNRKISARASLRMALFLTPMHVQWPHGVFVISTRQASQWGKVHHKAFNHRTSHQSDKGRKSHCNAKYSSISTGVPWGISSISVV